MLSNSRRKVFYTWLFLFLLMLILTAWNYPDEMFNLVIPGLTILMLIVMFAFNKIERKKLYKPTHYLFPLVVGLSLSFGLISIMFGLHTNIYEAYDDLKATDYDPFKWMKVTKIIEFPTDQINSKSEKYSVDNIDLSDIENPDSICHIIVIDKTGSLFKNSKLEDSLRTIITNSFYVDQKAIQKAKINDLIPAFIVSGLYKKSKPRKNEFISIWFYKGENEIIYLGTGTDKYYTEIYDEFQNPNSTYICDYFTRICNTNEYRVTNQITSIENIINSLSIKTKTIEDLKRFPKFKVTLISDFINSNLNNIKVDFHEIKGLVALNLFCLDGYDKGNPRCSAFEAIRNETDDYSLLNYKKVINFKNNQNDGELLQSLAISNSEYIDKRTICEIKFHYPHKAFNTKEKAIARVHILSPYIGNYEQKKYYFRLYDDKDTLSKFPYFINAKSFSRIIVGRAGETKILYLYKDDTLTIELPFASSILSNNRIYCEITDLQEQKTCAYSVSILPRMPENTSIYLLICLAVFIVSLSLILILPNSFIFNLYKQNLIKDNDFNNKKSILKYINIIALALPVSLGIFWIISFYFYVINRNNSMGFLVLILIILLGFCLPAYYERFKDVFDNHTRERLQPEPIKNRLKNEIKPMNSPKELEFNLFGDFSSSFSKYYFNKRDK